MTRGSAVRLQVRSAIVDATHGSGGGYRLARPATDIHLLEVVETRLAVKSG